MKKLETLQVGQEAEFPIAKMSSVRAVSSDMGITMNRRYATQSKRAEGVITVQRTA